MNNLYGLCSLSHLKLIGILYNLQFMIDTLQKGPQNFEVKYCVQNYGTIQDTLQGSSKQYLLSNCFMAHNFF